VVDTHAKMTGNVGTPAWIAPEVLQNKKYTEKADVYRCGSRVILEYFKH
jgi:serine/threonine protein kinase